MDRKNPLISPLYGEKEDFDPDTQTIVILADKDTLRKEGEQMAEKLIGFGQKVQCYTAQGMGHGYFEYGYREWQAYVPELIKQAAQEGTLTERVQWAAEKFAEFYRA